MIVSGVLTYAFHIVAARTLGPAAYGQIAVLWGAMFLIAIVLFRPVEQTMSRSIADRLARGEEVRSVLRAVGSLSLMLVVGAAVLAILGWSTLTERLFDGDNAMTTMLVAGVVAYGMSYLVRGVLGGTRWFAGYSLGLVVDSVARLAVAAPLLLVASKLTAATAVVAAGVAGAIVPLLVGRKHLRGLRDPGAGAPFKLSARCRSQARRVSWPAPTSSSSTAARSSSSPRAGRAPRAWPGSSSPPRCWCVLRLRVPGARGGAAAQPHPFAGGLPTLRSSVVQSCAPSRSCSAAAD